VRTKNQLGWFNLPHSATVPRPLIAYRFRSVSSADWAYQISWSNAVCLSVCLCVWMLTMVAQIVTHEHALLISHAQIY